MEFSKAQMECIEDGYTPRRMEEKWFIFYMPEERKLYMNRSWTGFCMYVVQFEERDDKFVAVSAVANRNPYQYKGTSEEEDKAKLKATIDHVLLGGPPNPLAA